MVSTPPKRRRSSGSRSGSGSGSRKKKKGGGGGGGGGYNPRAAERRAIARENKAKARAAARYRAQAKTLDLQANALKKSLGSGFEKALKIRLSNAGLVWRQQDAALEEGYEIRANQLEKGAAENTAAYEDSSMANRANRARERQSAVSNALLQGAGESDVLRAQTMSMRSWQSNQQEANRSFFDSLHSVNSSLSDLNVDTKTARLNAESQYNNDQDQLWTQFYNQKSEAYTQLGNVYGQQAELYGLAHEQKSGSSGAQKSSSKKSGSAFMSASDFASRAWKNPGNSSRLLEWKGEGPFEGRANDSVLRETTPEIPAPKRPEGASLRAWA